MRDAARLPRVPRALSGFTHCAKARRAGRAGCFAAGAVLDCARRHADAAAAQPISQQWDAQLKAAGINPGTSADLAVATAFLADIVRSPFGHAHSEPWLAVCLTWMVQLSTGRSASRCAA